MIVAEKEPALDLVHDDELKNGAAADSMDETKGGSAMH